MSGVVPISARGFLVPRARGLRQVFGECMWGWGNGCRVVAPWVRQGIYCLLGIAYCQGSVRLPSARKDIVVSSRNENLEWDDAPIAGGGNVSKEWVEEEVVVESVEWAEDSGDFHDSQERDVSLKEEGSGSAGKGKGKVSAGEAWFENVNIDVDEDLKDGDGEWADDGDAEWENVDEVGDEDEAGDEDLVRFDNGGDGGSGSRGLRGNQKVEQTGGNRFSGGRGRSKKKSGGSALVGEGDWESVDIDGVEEWDENDAGLGAGELPEGKRVEGKGGKRKRRGERTIMGEEKSGKLVLPGGVRLTERDVALLSFLARFRVATVGQLAMRFGTSESALRNRLPRLERAGFLAWAWTGVAKPKVWTVTDVGLRVCGIDLNAPQIRWGTLRHSLGLVDIAVAFELAGETVVSEREIRAAATRYVATERMRTAVDMWAGLKDLSADDEESVVEGLEGFGRLVGEGFVVPVPGRGLGHIPDMVVLRSPFEDGSSANIAIELELNRKSLSEWKVILGGYRDSDIFRRVVYYVVSEEVERSLLGSIRALGAEGKIEVQRFVPNEKTAEPWASGRGQFG